ncbi:MAG: GDSL-type esterase/lipase family protein [Promethearchaeota archaeon]
MIAFIISIACNAVLLTLLIILLYLTSSKLKNIENKKLALELFDISGDDIVFLGDSITEGCQWSELFDNTRIKNRGIGGDSSKGVFERIDKLIEGRPSKLFLCIGSNDFVRGIKLDQTIEYISKILTRFQLESKNTVLYLHSVLPVRGFSPNLNTNKRINKINSSLKVLAGEMGITFIDINQHLCDGKGRLDEKYSIDGLHLNGAGYLVWKDLLKKFNYL